MGKNFNFKIIALPTLLVVFGAIAIVGFKNIKTFNATETKTKSVNCSHQGRMWHQNKTLATNDNPGTREYWACCDCHDAFDSYDEITKTVGRKLGNTINDKASLFCYDIDWNKKVTENYSLYDLATQSKTIIFSQDISTDGVHCGETENDKIYFSNDEKTKELKIFSKWSIRISNNDLTKNIGMFSNCTEAKTIIISNVEASSLTTFEKMFYCCTNLTTVEIPTIDTSSVTSTIGMFYNCINLNSILVSDYFNLNNVSENESNNMFYNCINLKGGKGTSFNPNYINKKYAHIDEGKTDPGYLSNMAMIKEQTLSLFCENEYGFIPDKAKKSCTYDVDEEIVKNNIRIRKIIMTYENYDMRTYLYVPSDNIKHKTFVFILHEYAEKIADKDLVNNYQSLSTYVPIDYIISRGYAVMLVCTSDVVPDEKDSSRPSIIKHLKTEETDNSWGALQAWSWATSKSLDYLLTLKDEIIEDNIIVIGHSRGGKAALLTAAQDERFYMAVSSCSGNSGAALSRNNTGETIKDICTNFPYWFCKNYQQYMDNEDSLPFDQHQLLGLIAPRRVYVSSATEDTWACPKNELESCRKATFIYNENNASGLLATSKIETDKSYNEGKIGYHYKTGNHSIEERDWKMYMDYIDFQTNS